MKKPRSTKPLSTYRPTWAEVDLSAIRHNFLRIRGIVGKKTMILAAVKTNAYGHGMLEVSDIMVKAGVDYLGVGATDEALCLRRNGFKVPVLMLGSVLRGEIEPIVKNRITQTVGDMQLASSIDRYAGRSGKKAKVHVKIDIGMGRLGIWHKEALFFIKELLRLKNLWIEGVFSHLPSADEDAFLTQQQIQNFSSLVEELEELGIHIPYKHIANSVATLGYEDSHMNLVRPGIILYGLCPNPVFTKSGALRRGLRGGFRPALSLKSRIVFIKDVPPGRRISYGGTHTTRRHTRVATIPVGYGDGFNRQLSNRGSVLIRGRRAPIIGRVCMDQIMVDAGRIPGASVGDEAVLIGTQGKGSISVEEIAALCNTIPYEVTCWLDQRIPRLYKK
ncbi:MAG: alanine racemase [Candidatus Omnitrophica bacterium]|nr:alanine racemase [Candidatus Omnitrophota bacterium]